MRERLREVADQPLRLGSYSSASRPTSLRSAEQPLEQSRAPRRAGPAAPGCRRARTCTRRNAPSPGGRPSTPGVASGSARRSRRASARARSPSTVPRTRGSLGGRKPTSGIISRLASRSVAAVGLHEGVARGVEAAWRRPRRGSRRAARASASTRPVEPEALDVLDRAVERHPRHHLRVGEVPPRAAHLPDALVRLASRPSRGSSMQLRAGRARRRRSAGKPARRADVEARPSPRRRRRAGTARGRRCRCAPAASPRSRAASPSSSSVSRRSPARPYMIWSCAGLPGDRPQQPLAPRRGLVDVAAHHQRVEREGGVAQPAVAVVPVAHAAELLGQRRGRRGDDAAGRRVGQRLERDQRAHARRRATVPSYVQRADHSRHQSLGVARARRRDRSAPAAARATDAR